MATQDYPIGCLVYYHYTDDDSNDKRYGYVSFESLTNLDEDEFSTTPSGITDERVAYYHDPYDNLRENYLDFIKHYAFNKELGSDLDLFIDNVVKFVFSREDI